MGFFVRTHLIYDESKKCKFRRSPFSKKHVNLTIDPLSLGICAPGYVPRAPTFRPTDPKVCGRFESQLRSRFWARNGALKGSRIFRTKGSNFPFRGARPKLTSDSDFPYPKPHSTHFWYQRVFLGGFTEPKQFPASDAPGPKYRSVW